MSKTETFVEKSLINQMGEMADQLEADLQATKEQLDRAVELLSYWIHSQEVYNKTIFEKTEQFLEDVK